jgi:glycosyltransferase involved in cell wall biosynthesis
MTDPQKQKLSVLIITLNEELNIKSFLEDIDFADEIIVIDSYSEDQTAAIAQTFSNVKVIQNEFINFTAQRNFAINQAKHSWILFMDADERLTPDLKSEIISTVNSSSSASAYLFNRTFMFKKEKLHFSGWQTDKIFRLFDKNKCYYTEERFVHEKLKVDGRIEILNHKLVHFSYTDFNSYKNKMRSYGVLKAKEKHIKGLKPTLFMTVFHPIYTFLYQYLIRLGFLDGRKGIIICYLNAYSVFVRHKELKKITSKT